MYDCVRMCMSVCTYERIYVCMYVYMYICIYVYMGVPGQVIHETHQ